jgi:ribosomal protein L37AE/L43A
LNVCLCADELYKGTIAREVAAYHARLPVNSIGTCSRCGYYGPGPGHDCPALTPAEQAEIIAGAPGQIGPGQTPIGRPLPAAASLEERAMVACQAYDETLGCGKRPCFVDGVARNGWLAVVRAVDASNPMHGALTAVGFPAQDGESLDKAFARAWEWCVDHAHKAQEAADASRPGLTERDVADIELARAIRDTLRETTHDGAIERLEELLDVEKTAADRPTLTEDRAIDRRRSETGPLPACPRCSKSDWTRMPDSLAMACKACGLVLVGTSGGEWKPGASLQEWAADLARAKGSAK